MSLFPEQYPDIPETAVNPLRTAVNALGRLFGDESTHRIPFEDEPTVEMDVNEINAHTWGNTFESFHTWEQRTLFSDLLDSGGPDGPMDFPDIFEDDEDDEDGTGTPKR